MQFSSDKARADNWIKMQSICELRAQWKCITAAKQRAKRQLYSNITLPVATVVNTEPEHELTTVSAAQTLQHSNFFKNY